jgi:CTP:phosphocholine cytidylyltransferase-like protein
MKTKGHTSLTQIKNAKLLDYHIRYLTEIFPKNEIILCVGFDANKIQEHIASKYSNHNIRIVENQSFNETNSCEGLRLCLNNINNTNILIVGGDLFFHKEALSALDTKNNCLIFEDKNPTLDIGINTDGKKLEHMDVGLNAKWPEIIFINQQEAITFLKSKLNREDFRKKFMFEVINTMLCHKYKIFCIENKKHSIKLENGKIRKV